MKISIQSIHFDASAQLESFIQKKVAKLGQYCDDIMSAEVVLKVVKPETAQNIKLLVPKSDDIFSSKVADTFEEAVDVAVDALVKQLQKMKEKMRAK